MERIEPYIASLGLKFKSKLEHGIPEAKLNKPRIIDTNPEITRLRIDGHQWMEINTTRKRKLIKLSGEISTIARGTYKGMILLEYKIDFTENKGLLKRIKRIYIKHYLYTKYGYIELKSSDKILRSLRPIERLLEVAEKTLINKYQAQ